MRTIRVGLSIGFSVGELADIFRERNAGGAPCHRVRKLAAENLALYCTSRVGSFGGSPPCDQRQAHHYEERDRVSAGMTYRISLKKRRITWLLAALATLGTANGMPLGTRVQGSAEVCAIVSSG